MTNKEMPLMQADKELLTLAAKAGGYSVRWHENWQGFAHNNWINIDHPPALYGQRFVWNPLDDDGAAFRLIVKINEFEPYKSRGGFRLSTGASAKVARRAAVIVAAEIGKTLP